MDVPVVILAILTAWLTWLLAQSDAGEPAFALRVNQSVFDGTRIVRCKSWSALRVGLLNHSFLPEDSGLWLEGCRSVHTKGMRFAIDVVFVDAHDTVLRIVTFVEPGRTVRGPRGTRATLELASGAAEGRFQISAGDKIQLCLKETRRAS